MTTTLEDLATIYEDMRRHAQLVSDLNAEFWKGASEMAGVPAPKLLPTHIASFNKESDAVRLKAYLTDRGFSIANFTSGESWCLAHRAAEITNVPLPREVANASG